MAEEDKRKRITKTEIGSPMVGGYFYGSTPDDEYLAALKFPARVEIYDQMRRSDPQVMAVLNAIYNPILASEWVVEPASDSALDKEVADFISKNLLPAKEKIKKDSFHNKEWNQTLKEILTYAAFGFAVFEKVWTIFDGKVHLKKLSPRLQRTIDQFDYRDTDDLKYVIQNVEGDLREIPAKKTIIFTANKEGENPVGISYLRPVYKPWSIKVDFQKTQGITFERFGCGIPFGKLPQGIPTDSEEGAALIEALENIGTNESSYILAPNDTEVEILSGGANTVPDIQKAIDYCDQQITISFLAQFLNLGVSSFGSRALGNTFVDFFNNVIERIGNYVASKINRELIQELVDYNFDVEAYPELKMVRLNSVDLDNLAVLSEAGIITSTIETENRVRKTLGMPEISKEDYEKASEEEHEATQNVNKEDIPNKSEPKNGAK